MSSLNHWVTFHLIALVVLLWAVFLEVKGEMLWISLTLIIIVIGVSFAVVYGEVQQRVKKKELQKKIVESIKPKEEMKRRILLLFCTLACEQFLSCTQAASDFLPLIG